MKIHKIGHCCLLIKTQGVTLLTDPGAFTTGQNELTGIDAILITHEHGDHLHVESLEQILTNNPEVRVITNASVGKLLDEKGIAYEVVEGTATTTVQELSIQAHDAPHEEIYGDFGLVQNTGYFIGERLFYPGDAFSDPEKQVDILALPVAGPWCRVKDAIDYAKQLNPKHVFPVHDGALSRPGSAHNHASRELTAVGIEFVALKDGEEVEW